MTEPSPSASREGHPALPLSRRKRYVFAAVATLLPFLLLALLEVGLRVGGYGRERALFVPAPFDSARYLVANPRFAARYFPGDPSPPTPPGDAFLRVKPADGFRLFVLGESTTAGFPFAANGTFSRVLADALRDVLPDAAVEVVNVGIPATNTYALYDELPEILAQRPDAVLIYAGHNEWYGALGAASTVRLAGKPSLVRLTLRLRQWRLVMLLERGLAVLRQRQPVTVEAGASRMEELATADTLRLGSPGYVRGRDQFRENLDLILSRLRDARVPAYVGSLASNLRDQAPFASDSGDARTSAAAAFAAARTALGRNDPAAQSLFSTARDLDLIRFRAPSEFNRIVEGMALARGATYVPVVEHIVEASPGRIPGSSLFFEHVHPRPAGTTLIARAFFEALQANGFHGRQARGTLAPWPGYTERMALTPVDTQVATIIVEALRHRWPFAPRGTRANYLATYSPRTATDSNALAVVSGRANWTQAKLAEAARFERAGDFARAMAEYRGLMRDQPWNESPFRFAARAAIALNQFAEATRLLERAHALEPTPYTSLTLGRLLAQDSTQLPRARQLVQQSMQLGGPNPDALFQLSLIEARLGNLAGARTAAAALSRVAPRYPGLAEWMRLLQMR